MDTSADHSGCCGLNHEGSSDASEESVVVWLVLGVINYGFLLEVPCLSPHVMCHL